MATIDSTQDYDLINTLTFSAASGTCPIRLYRGGSSVYSGTVYYRKGTSGGWTSLSVSGTTTTFPVTSKTMQVGLNWNKDGNNYMTPSFYGGTTITGIAMSQKAALSGTIGNYFMYYYAYGCSSLTTLDVPDTSSVTTVGTAFMQYYADGCTSLTTLDVPDTSSVTTTGVYFMSRYATDCTSLKSLSAPDTSSITTVGSYFMYSYANGCTSLKSLSAPDTSSITTTGAFFIGRYADGCTSLTSLSIPDTSSITTVGNNFMVNYAYNCSSLTTLKLPAVGWFKDNNINWSVPSSRLGYLKGEVINENDLQGWKDLTASTKTLYINYIQDADDVIYTAPSVTGDSGFKLLLESGDSLLLESGDSLLLENIVYEAGASLVADSTASLTAGLVKTSGGTLSSESTAELIAALTVAGLATLNAESTASMTAEVITADIVGQASLVADSTASLTATMTWASSANLQGESTATLSAGIIKISEISLDAESSATMTAGLVKTSGGLLQSESTATLTAKISRGGGASLNAESYASLTAHVIYAGGATLQAESSSSLQAGVIYSSSATLQAESTASLTGVLDVFIKAGGKLEATSTASLTAVVFGATPESAIKYLVEVRDSAGNLVSILENAYDRVYTQRVNEPQQLSFSIPADDDKVSGLAKPNQIWLRDYSTGTLIRKFVITRLVKKDSGNCTYQVECKGYLSKLLKAVVRSYSPSGKTPTEILTALLAYQTLDTITLGTVDITGTYSFSWSNTTVLACLNDCLTAWGGFFDVDNDNVLTWLDDIGSDVGQQIRYKKNLVTVEVETDYEGQNSRIYATGNSLDLLDYEPSFDTVDKSADASFGYLTLQDYKCYTGWTGDGDALPYGVGYDITVYRVISEFSISFFSCSGAGWTDTAKAIDGSTGTAAYYNVNGWTGYLNASVNVTPVLCTGLRWFIWADLSSYIIDIEVQYSTNGTDWITVVDAWQSVWFNDWGQYDFAEPTLVKYMRLRVRTNAPHYVYVYEMEMRSTYVNDTADFVQGANEQIVKCAIGDYHSGDTYYLGYTHAFYIKDFTAAATYGDEAINATFNYAGDAETLLKYAQAQMALIKNPPKYYQSGIIFLNEVDANFSFEELDLGNIVKIIHEPLNVEDSVRIVAMTQDLDNPANGSIEIQTKIRSLADSFRALWARI